MANWRITLLHDKNEPKRENTTHEEKNSHVKILPIVNFDASFCQSFFNRNSSCSCFGFKQQNSNVTVRYVTLGYVILDLHILFQRTFITQVSIRSNDNPSCNSNIAR